jgi:hypothetical protein
MPRLSLPVQSYALRSTPASPSRLVNCFAEKLPEDAKSPSILVRAPGAKARTTVGTGPIIAQHVALGYNFVVSGRKLWQMDVNNNRSLIGDIGVPGNIDIDSNDTSIVIVNEPYAFYWDGTTFGQITDSDFTSRGAADVEFLNNFLLFREPNSGRFFGADLGSATSYEALDFATAEGSPDEMVGLKVDHLQAVAFGETSTEIWENDANAGAFPFIRAVNGFLELGCFNGRTVAKLDNSIFWLANDYTVRRLDGVTPVRVSTHAIEQRIGDWTISAARATTYTQEGHLFYVLSFQEGTVVYDATTGLWHERQTYGEDNWIWSSAVNFDGKVLVGDTTSNAVAELDTSTYADLGGVQRMEFTFQTIYAEQERAYHDRLEMVFEPGVGLTSGQGSDPEVMLEKSDDGGKSWVSLPNRKLGRIGRYEQRVIWHALGSARQRVYRAAVSDPVSVTLADTFVELRGGRL